MNPGVATSMAPNLPGPPWAAPREMQECSFRIPRVQGNPFELCMWVAVETPRGSIVRLPAFHDGGDVWRMRYTAFEPGLHRLAGVSVGESALASEPIAVEDLAPAAFQADSAPARHIVRRSSAHVQRFERADGTPYFPIGYNHAWGPGSEYPLAFARMKVAGLDWSRVWMNHWANLNLDWVLTRKVEPGTIDLAIARTWDGIVESAAANGIAIQLVLQHHGQYSTRVNQNWTTNPWNVANGGWLATAADFFTDEKARRITRQKYRYIVARWGYSPAIMAWELFNEVEFTDGYIGAGLMDIWRDVDPKGLFDHESGRRIAALYEAQQHEQPRPAPVRMEQFGNNMKSMTAGRQQCIDFGLGRQVVADWHREMASVIRSVDVYGHLITTSSLPVESRVWSDMDFYQAHVYRPAMIEPLARPDIAPACLDKPIFIAEMGDHSITDSGKSDGRYMHSMLWAGLFSGAAGAAQVWAWDRVAQLDLWRNYRVLTSFAAEARLADGPFLPVPAAFHPDPAPAGESIKPNVLALAGEQSIALWISDLKGVPIAQHFPIIGTLRVQKPAGWGPITVSWINTRTGALLGPRTEYRQWPESLRTPSFSGDAAAILTNNAFHEFRRQSACARN